MPHSFRCELGFPIPFQTTYRHSLDNNDIPGGFRVGRSRRVSPPPPPWLTRVFIISVLPLNATTHPLSKNPRSALGFCVSCTIYIHLPSNARRDWPPLIWDGNWPLRLYYILSLLARCLRYQLVVYQSITSPWRKEIAWQSKLLSWVVRIRLSLDPWSTSSERRRDQHERFH